MSPRRKWTLVFAAAALLVASAAWAEREWRVYKSFEDEADDAPLPADFNKPAGFVVARLMYPSNVSMGRRRFGGYGDWRQGGTSWAVDYPRGDRYFAGILKRLTTIDVRSVEQPVNLEDGNDVFDWPYLIVGLAGYWDLTDDMAKKLRDYLERGGFLLADSFFGSNQWEGFVYGMHQIFPDREIVDLPTTIRFSTRCTTSTRSRWCRTSTSTAARPVAWVMAANRTGARYSTTRGA